MNILVLSLLRLGDVFIAAPALKGLRKKYPDARIHLVINKSSSSAAHFLPYVDRFIEFDRDEIQHGLVRTDRPLLEPYDRLDLFVNEINKINVDMAINLTQNKISANLMGLIQAKEKFGLTTDASGQSQFYSQWFKHLNDVIEAGAETIFHYSDIFYYGLGLPRGEQSFALAETPLGQDELNQFLRVKGFKSGPKIIIQMLTSDTKKNWGDNNWFEMLKILDALMPTANFILLGAPNEKSTLEKMNTRLGQASITATVAILSLEGAYSLLQISDLVITGDTSIKHLAATSNVPLVEISLGSSNLKKTGAYQENTLILKSIEKCSPCGHSSPCHRERQFCAEGIAPEIVAMVASKRIQNDWPALRLLATEYEDVVEMYKTKFLQTGFWQAENLCQRSDTKRLSAYLDLTAWHFYLNSEHLQPLATYGTESLKLRKQIEEQAENLDCNGAYLLLSQIEVVELKNESQLEKISAKLHRNLQQTGFSKNLNFIESDLKDEICAIERKLRLGRYLSEKVSGKSEGHFYQIRQLQASLSTVQQHQKIKIKLLRSLKNQMKEVQ